jgi:hypothetical protein
VVGGKGTRRMMVTRSRRKEVPQGYALCVTSSPATELTPLLSNSHTRPTRQKGTTDWHFETSVLTRFFTLGLAIKSDYCINQP